MSNLRPTVVEGSIIDLPINPHVVLRFVTNTPGGQGLPIKRPNPPRPMPEQPKDLGEERHTQLMHAIKNLSIPSEGAIANIKEALYPDRGWRR